MLQRQQQQENQEQPSILVDQLVTSSTGDQNWDTQRREILTVYNEFLSRRESNMESSSETTLSLSIAAEPSTEDADLDLPIALRRRKRRCSSISAASPVKAQSQTTTRNKTTRAVQEQLDDNGDKDNTITITTAPATPSRTRRKKRVRFSDPGPSMTAANSTPSKTTGLTPFVRRTNISTPSSRSHNRRLSAPAMGTPHPGLVAGFDFSNANMTMTQLSGEVQFTPLRQVLDERCKRRIRRNGLSEEVNSIEAERREREWLKKEIEEKDEMLKAMREELEKNSHTSHDKETVQSTEDGTVMVPASTAQSIEEVEEELRVLRQSMQEVTDDDVDVIPNSVMVTDGAPNHSNGTDLVMSNNVDASGDTIPIFEDDDAMTEPFGSPSIYEEAQTQFQSRDASTAVNLPDLDRDAELLGMALDLEAAKQEKRELFKEWRTHFQRGLQSTGLHFTDTPSRNTSANNSFTRSLPSPPPNFLQQLSSNLKATTSRAEDAELALCAVETELRTLGFAGQDGSDIVAEIKRHFRAARLEMERAMPGETTYGFDGNRNVLPDMINKMKKLLRHVRDREAELRSLNEQHRSLKGNFDHALDSIDKATRKIADLEDTLDSNAEELLDGRMRLQELEREDKQKDESLKCLAHALDKYRADVTSLEQLITKMESEEPFKIQAAAEEVQQNLREATTELEQRVSAEQQGRLAAEEIASQRQARLEELECSFGATTEHAMDVQYQLNTLRAEKEEEEFKLKKRLHETDEQYQAHLGSLNSKISNLTTALDAAESEIAKLKGVRDRLELRLQTERERGQRFAETVQHRIGSAFVKINEPTKSYLRGTKISCANSELEEEKIERNSSPASSVAPMTPVSVVRFVDAIGEEDEWGQTQSNVEILRGKGKDRGRRARRYDSGVGMMSDGEIMSDDLNLELGDGEVDIVE